MQYKRTCLKLITALLATMMVASASALDIKPDAPAEYTVKPGDTLWDISSLYLEQPWLWPQLWRNNTHIENPHLIFPGDKLVLTISPSGEATLTVDRVASKTTIKLTPQGRKVLKGPGPVSVLPWDVIAPYIKQDQILDEEFFKGLPKLLGNNDGNYMFTNEDLVATGLPNSQQENWQVIREQQKIVDMQGNLLGVQVRHVADATAPAMQTEGPVLAHLSHTNLEARQGDRLMPASELVNQDMKLQPVTDTTGQVVDSLEQRLLLGKFDVVIIDLGSDQVNPGSVLGIYDQGPGIFDGKPPVYNEELKLLGYWSVDGDEIQQPAIKVGEVVVFRVFEKASYALITRANKTIRKGVFVARP